MHLTMSAPTATTTLVHQNPIIISLKTFQKPNSLSLKFSFCGEFVVPRLVFRQTRSRGSKAMDRPIKISAFKEISNSEVDREALELEGLVHGSSRLNPNFSPTRFESTLNNMSKWLVTAIFVSIIVIRHDAKVLWAAMGTVLNVLLSNVLKKIINQERPVSSLKPDPGMPSSHAQSIFFIFSFAVISMIDILGVNGLTIALSGLILAIGLYLSWLRVSQKLHTIWQVVVGAAVGSSFSLFWFWSWDIFVRDIFASSLWVRILVVLGAAGFCVGFTIYAIKNWLMERK